MIHVMEKNYFAAIDFRLAAALAAGLGGMFSGASPSSDRSRDRGWGNLWACDAILNCSSVRLIAATWLEWCQRNADPFIFPALFYAILNSAWVTTRQGGIYWRNTFISRRVTCWSDSVA